MKQNKLTFYIKNHTDQILQMPLFTNGEDNNGNAKRCFYYDISTATFDGTESTVQVRANGNSDYITYSLGILSNLAELIAALNTLGFGTWYKNNAGTQLVICNDNLVFGDLQINTTNSTFRYVKAAGGVNTGFFINMSTNIDVHVNWGDGNTDDYSGANNYNPTHVYADNAIRTIRVTIATVDQDKVTNLIFGENAEVQSISDLDMLTNLGGINTNFADTPQPLESIGALPASLTSLVSKKGQLASLPVLNTTALATIDVSGNSTLAGAVPAFPATVTSATFDDCPITSFAHINAGIVTISAKNTALTSASAWLSNTTLKNLYISGTPLTFIGNYPTNCENFEADGCGATTLNSTVPNAMKNLVLSNNNFPSLSKLGTGMISLIAASAGFGGRAIGSTFNLPALVHVELQNNHFSTTTLSNCLIELDAAGTINGTVRFDGQVPAAPPNAGGNTAKANLIAKGWTVLTD